MKTILTIIILVITVVSAQAASNVTFGWDASNGATGYRVYQSNSSGVYNKISGKVCDVATTTCTVSNIPDGRYYWVATAYNATGESGYSNEVTVTLTPPIPGAPSNFKINLTVNVTVNP